MIFNIYSRKNKTLIAQLILVSASYGGYAQTKDLPALNSVRTPNSPAFSVLGVQPTSVERPNTPADLTLAIDNATESFTKLPQNFALEFAPWWMSRSAASLKWQSDTVRSFEESIFRTFSFSLATTSKKVNNKDLRGLSYGFRTMLASGRVSRKSVKKIEDLEIALSSVSKEVSERFQAEEMNLLNRLNAQMGLAKNATDSMSLKYWYNDERSKITEKKAKMIDDKNKELSSTGENMADDFTPQREGLIIEVAFAGAYKSDTTSSELARNGYAYWITPSYVMEDFSFVGVYRKVKDSLANESTEYGARLIYQSGRYAVSAEYLKGEYTTPTTLPPRERFSVLLEYVLTKDLWLSLSFGNDNRNIGNQSSVFSSAGIRYNIHKDRYSFKPN